MTPEILVKGLPSGYEVEHLARIFFPGSKVRNGPSTRGALVYARAGKGRLVAGLRGAEGAALVVRCAPPPVRPADARLARSERKFAENEPKFAEGEPKFVEGELKFALCRLLYDLLREQTGITPPWGLLTGVRPLNLLRKKLRQGGEVEAKTHFLQRCDVSPGKFALAGAIEKTQRPILAKSTPQSYSLYVSIPFCPTRCAYCSFVSRTTRQEGHLIEPYLQKLEEELAETAGIARECGLKLETVYIGGGTPTSLTETQLDRLLAFLERTFHPAETREYTVEAGRPDCTDAGKLRLLKNHGVNRVSINPQTMRDDVLRRIGRCHTSADVLRCYEDAREAGFASINMDLIAGLPGDDAAGFAETLDAVTALKPENITLHTLTLKRASNLVIERYGTDVSPGGMVASAYPRFEAAGYAPYYLYRQKSGVGAELYADSLRSKVEPAPGKHSAPLARVENLENTGWSLPGAEGIYNVFIMEEAHTILACGAGASTKLVRPAAQNSEAVIRRRYNHKLPLEYIQNFDEIIERKRGVKAFYACDLDTETTG